MCEAPSLTAESRRPTAKRALAEVSSLRDLKGATPLVTEGNPTWDAAKAAIPCVLAVRKQF